MIIIIVNGIGPQTPGIVDGEQFDDMTRGGGGPRNIQLPTVLSVEFNPLMTDRPTGFLAVKVEIEGDV